MNSQQQPLSAEEAFVPGSSSESCSLSEEKNYIDETKLQRNENKTAKLKVFIYNKENDKTISIKVKPNVTIKNILNFIIKKEFNQTQGSKYRYCFIDKRNKEILNPEKNLSFYKIQNESILILAARQLFKSKINLQNNDNNKNKNNKEYQGENKFMIICNFGTPYNDRKLLSTYHGSVSLNEYARVLKDKYGISESTKITFNFLGVPCIGKDRTCGIQKLGIKPNDTIIAQTNGINLTVKSFDSPNNVKLIEIYKNFDLNMLKEQIKLELGISDKFIKALICKGGRIIDHDNKCKEIKQYETITVLKTCNCHLKNKNKIINKNKNKNKIKNKITNKNKNTLIDTPNNPSDIDEERQYYIHRSNYRFPRSVSNYYPFPDRVCKMYRKKIPTPNHQGNNIHNMHNYHANYPPFNQQNNNHYADKSSNHYLDVELMNFLNTNNHQNNNHYADESSNHYLDGDKLQICRYGDNCRYFKNPHISGPCRYYHPPPILEQNYSWKTHYTLHHGTTKKNKYKTNYTIT